MPRDDRIEELRAETRRALREARDDIRSVVDEASLPEAAMLFLGVPLVLLLVELAVQLDTGVLEDITRDQLRYNLTRPRFTTAFTSAYAHANLDHLRRNLTSYLFLMSALYPVAIQSGRRRMLRVLLAFNLLATPFLVAGLSIQSSRGFETTIGFSAVGAALAGVLLVLVFLAASDRIDRKISPFWVLVPAALMFAGILWVLPIPPWMGLVLAAAGVVGAVMFVLRHGTATVRDLGGTLTPPEHIVMFWGFGLALVTPVALFVLVPPRANLFGHLAGYYIGLTAAIIWTIGAR